jgi:hypothetical protein
MSDYFDRQADRAADGREPVRCGSPTAVHALACEADDGHDGRHWAVDQNSPGITRSWGREAPTASDAADARYLARLAPSPGWNGDGPFESVAECGAPSPNTINVEGDEDPPCTLEEGHDGRHGSMYGSWSDGAGLYDGTITESAGARVDPAFVGYAEVLRLAGPGANVGARHVPGSGLCDNVHETAGYVCARPGGHGGQHADAACANIWDRAAAAIAYRCPDIYTTGGEPIACALPEGHGGMHVSAGGDQRNRPTPSGPGAMELCPAVAPHSTPGMPVACQRSAGHIDVHLGNDSTSWADDAPTAPEPEAAAEPDYPGPAGTQWIDRDGDLFVTGDDGGLHVHDVPGFDRNFAWDPSVLREQWGPLTRLPDGAVVTRLPPTSCRCGSPLAVAAQEHDGDCTARAAEHEASRKRVERRDQRMWATEQAVKAHARTRFLNPEDLRVAIVETADAFLDSLDDGADTPEESP